MIDDSERREVAARLRESREFISCLPKTTLEQNAFDTFELILACVGYEQGNLFDHLADLIDRPTCKNAELMAELDDWKGNAEGFQPDAYMKLPLDADGVPIRIGDVVVDICGEYVFVVNGYCKIPNSEKMGFMVEGDRGIYEPSAFLHKKPEPADSLERIADELEAAEDWCDKNGDYDTGIVSISEPKLREWSDRIRRLAKKEDEHATN